jgi:hypothetical protein
MPTVLESAKDKLAVVLVTTVVSLATVFSDRIVGSIKSGVNKADQRPARQEAIAKDISIFIFTAENALEFLEKNETTKAQLHFVVDPYNDAVVTLRKNQYVYLAAVQRYWDKPVVQQYETFFTDVLGVDTAFHAFNDEFSAVEAGTKTKADEAKIRPLVTGVSAAVVKLEQSSKQLLTALSK